MMSKILLLVEGEKTEKELFQRLYQLYEEDNLEIEIISYKTNIYAFYNGLKKRFKTDTEKIEYKAVDLALLLNDHLKLKGVRQYSDSDFIEKILVFDFDPHDSNYSENILIELMENFSNSTDIGKLYLNYPMIESFKDMESLEDENFMSSNFSKSMLVKNGYKQHIHQQSLKNKINRIDKIDKETARKLIDLHQQKLEFITKLSTSTSKKYLHLCQKQCKKLSEEGLIWVINTSILHLFDEYGVLKGDDTICHL